MGYLIGFAVLWMAFRKFFRHINSVFDSWYELGLKHETGKGVPQNYKEAVKWYTKAAEQGNAKAQYSLGLMYFNGQGGVPQDYVIAHMYCNLAAMNGDKDAIVNRGIVEKKMTPTQIAESQRKARGWKRTHQ